MDLDLMLDTCALLSLTGIAERKLSRPTLDKISETRALYISSCSLFEISLKLKRQQLKLTPFDDAWAFWQKTINHYDIEVMPVSDSDFLQSVQLPDFHLDPFDRIIIAQALANDLQLVTYDRKFENYEITAIC